jgi:hypothetical protein
MGLQFENLVLNSRIELHRLMHVNPEEIVNDNPFYQRQTIRQAGCQIDYMIQLKYGTLYICEISAGMDDYHTPRSQSPFRGIQRVIGFGFAL